MKAATAKRLTRQAREDAEFVPRLLGQVFAEVERVARLGGRYVIDPLRQSKPVPTDVSTAVWDVLRRNGFSLEYVEFVPGEPVVVVRW